MTNETTAQLMREAPRRRDDSAPPDYCASKGPGLVRWIALLDAKDKVRDCCAAWLRSEPNRNEWLLALTSLKTDWDASRVNLKSHYAKRNDPSRALGANLASRIVEAKRLGATRVTGRQMEKELHFREVLESIDQRLERIEAKLGVSE